jgi:hypothetical protein
MTSCFTVPPATAFAARASLPPTASQRRRRYYHCFPQYKILLLYIKEERLFRRSSGIRERLTFAQGGITWRRERLQRIYFTDEVWAIGGAHTNPYVTVLEDGVTATS